MSFDIGNLDKTFIKSVDNNGVVIINPMDNIKVEFKIKKNINNNDNIFLKCFMDENCRCWGEYYEYHKNGAIYYNGFYVNNLPIGMFKFYNEDSSISHIFFYSFEKPSVEIDENEYKRQLAKIRLGMLKVPALGLKVSDYEQ